MNSVVFDPIETKQKSIARFQVHYLCMDGELGDKARAAADRYGLTYSAFAKRCIIFALEHLVER